LTGWRVKARVICGPTESEEKVRAAILNALAPCSDLRFTVHRVTGIFGEPLKVIEAVATEGAAEAARSIIGKLPRGYLSERIEKRGTGETIHIRLNKQLAYLGIIQPSESDAIKIEISSEK